MNVAPFCDERTAWTLLGCATAGMPDDLLSQLIFLTLSLSMTSSSHFDSNQTIYFVVANRGRRRGGCSFRLPTTASVVDLYQSARNACNVSGSAEVQLLGQTIANLRSSRSQIIDEIPIMRSLMNDLSLIWGPGYRVPIQLHRRVSSDKDWIIYASLFQMFGQSHSNVLERDWYRFVLKCMQSRSCLIEDLCDRFHKLFYCDEDGIAMLSFVAQQLNGSIDLSKIPRSVKKVLLQRNIFSVITGLNHLSGTQLRYLDIRGNPAQIDLKDLSLSYNDSMVNPLKLLRVNLRQISRCTVGIEFTIKGGSRVIDELVQAAVKQWIQTSTLDVLVIGRNHPKYIYREGRLHNQTDLATRPWKNC